MSPCRTCGACCASLRVSFPERDSDALGGRVPTALTVPRSPGHLAMQQVDGRCVALEGEVGSETTCRIYTSRPHPCEDFQPSTAAEPNPYCDESRARFGLPPLR